MDSLPLKRSLTYARHEKPQNDNEYKTSTPKQNNRSVSDPNDGKDQNRPQINSDGYGDCNNDKFNGIVRSGPDPSLMRTTATKERSPEQR